MVGGFAIDEKPPSVDNFVFGCCGSTYPEEIGDESEISVAIANTLVCCGDLYNLVDTGSRRFLLGFRNLRLGHVFVMLLPS